MRGKIRKIDEVRSWMSFECQTKNFEFSFQKMRENLKYFRQIKYVTGTGFSED